MAKQPKSITASGLMDRYNSIVSAIDELSAELQVVLTEMGHDGTVVSMGPYKSLELKPMTNKPTKLDKSWLKEMAIKW